MNTTRSADSKRIARRTRNVVELSRAMQRYKPKIYLPKESWETKGFELLNGVVSTWKSEKGIPLFSNSQVKKSKKRSTESDDGPGVA